MIRRLGSHTGRKIVFGYDRYLSDELDSYLAVLASHGEVSLAVDSDSLHYLSSAQRVCEVMQGEDAEESWVSLAALEFKDPVRSANNPFGDFHVGLSHGGFFGLGEKGSSAQLLNRRSC